MNDVDRWIYFDGPEPERLRPLLSALREIAAPRPTPEEKARTLAAILEKIDARLGRVPMTEGRAEEARGSAPPAAPAPSGDARSVDEVQALAKGEAPLGFDAWAALSFRFLGKSQEEKLEALGARKLTLQEWAAIDDDYLRMLYADLRAGRTDRQAVYATKCNEEMARRAKAPLAPKEDAPAPLPVVVPAPEALTSTKEQVDMPAAVWAAMGKLPFKPAPPGSPAPGQGTVKTMPVPVMRSDLGETLPLGSDAMQKAVAAVSFLGSEAGAGVVPFPALTVQQYVSLRADLAAMPERWTETLHRYGVPSEASRRALDEHWQEQLAARPALRAELDAAVATYTSWLRGLPG